MNSISGGVRALSLDNVMKWTLTAPYSILTEVAVAGETEPWPNAQGITLLPDTLTVGSVIEAGFTVLCKDLDEAPALLFGGTVTNDGNTYEILAITEDEPVVPGVVVRGKAVMTIMSGSLIRLVSEYVYWYQDTPESLTRLFYPGLDDDGVLVDYPIDLSKETVLSWVGGFEVVYEETVNEAHLLNSYLIVYPAPPVEE